MKHPERYIVMHWAGPDMISEESFASKRKARICIRKIAGRMMPGEQIQFHDQREGAE